jgi:branched-chain amino acid transport system substrate-binding protein
MLSLGVVALSGPAQAADPYKLGYITDLSGPLRDAYSPVMEGFKLYMKVVNDRGGINGHPVELFIRNDQLDATRASSFAMELITGEKINSIWGMSLTRTHKAVYQQALRYKTPAISCFSGIKVVLPPKAQDYAYSAGNAFEVTGEVSGKIAAQMLKGKGKMVVTTIEAPGGYAVAGHSEAAAKAGGLTTGRLLFSPRTTEFGAPAQKMKAMNPDIIAFHHPPAGTIGLFRNLRAIGYKGIMLVEALGMNEHAFAKAIESTGYTENTYIFARWALSESKIKEIDEVQAAAKVYGLPGKLSVGNVSGWTMGILAETALKQCGWPCSGVQLNNILKNITVDAGALLGGTIKFSTIDHYGTTLHRVYKYDGMNKTYQPVGAWIETSSVLKYKTK